MTSAVRIVLVGTTHPGNIGASARAMKNMGFETLYLVTPRAFPHPDAAARAAGAADVLETARVCRTLAEAVEGCGWVAATSARQRRPAWPALEPRDCAARLIEVAKRRPVAVVFGRERTGLSNEELKSCNALVNIPTDPAYSSLNLAMAVQIMAYELRLADGAQGGAGAPPPPPATAEERRLFFEHLEQVLVQTDFLDPGQPRYLMERLRRLFNRADPDQNEINILRGILAHIQAHLRTGQ